MRLSDIKWTLKSLRTGWVSSTLAACTLSLGVGVTITAISLLRVLSNDPIPERSGQLFYVQLDARTTNDGTDPSAEPPKQLTWIDATTILHNRHEMQAVMVGGLAPVSTSSMPKVTAKARFTTHAFFDIFNVPFQVGRSWGADADDSHAHVAVLSTGMARKMFGTTEVVGRTLLVGNTTFTVSGVIKSWQPKPRFYDLAQGGFKESEDVFLPLDTAVELKLPILSNLECWGNGFSMLNDLKAATCSWVQLWALLPDPSSIAAYRTFLHNYSEDQRHLGRYERPTNIRLSDVMAHLKDAGLITPMVSLQSYLAFGLLLACVVNAAAFMLVRALRRRGEFSLRRALGATRADIRTQLLSESLLIGITAALVGCVLGYLGVAIVNLQSAAYASSVHMDVSTALMAGFLSIMASMLSGLVPTWAVMRIQPATFLKAA